MQINEKEPIVLRPPIRQWIEAFNTRNVAVIVALYADGAELFDSGMPRPRRGRAEIERWFSWRFRSTPLTYTPIEQADDGNEQIVVSWIANGQGPRFFGQAWLSRPFLVNGKSCFTVRDGLIQKQHGVYDHLSVLKQIVPPLKWVPAAVARCIYAVYLWRNGQ
jgi:SnoaL-like domain